MSGDTPDLSVVIAAVNGPESLDACLDSLQRQRGNVSAEVILAEAAGSDVGASAARARPHVRRVAVEGQPSLPRLRAAGIRAARGDIVAMTEDHCLPAPDWYESICRAHAACAAAVAIGGAVDNAPAHGLVDWAVYFFEYGRYASPLQAGAAGDLPAPNVSYKRRVIAEAPGLVEDEYWETFLHDDLRRLGHQLWREPTIRVLHRMHFEFVPFLIERYHFGRAFAGRRNQRLRWSGRVLRGGLFPLLVPLLLLRIGRSALARPADWMRFIWCLPMVCCFAAAAAAGEGVGYIRGPGQSALRMR